VDKGTTRRGFFKKSALAAGGVAVGVVAMEIASPLMFKEVLEFDSNNSLWAHYRPPKNSPLTEDIELDVAVIGGGYTGLSSAYHIKKMFPGRSVAVFEAKHVGYGGSGRNGGLVGPQPAKDHMKIFSDIKTHKRMDDMTIESLHELKQLARSEGFGSEICHRGKLSVAVNENQLAEMKSYAETERSLGIPIEWWDREKTVHSLGTDVYYGALYDPRVWEINPMKLVHALKKAAERYGAVIYEESPVSAIEEGEVITLTVGEQKHTVKAKAVVLATNGYTTKLGYFKNSVLAIHTQMAVTPPLSESIFSELGWRNRIPFADRRNYLYHIGNTTDNRIFVAGGKAYYFFNNGIIYRVDRDEAFLDMKQELIRVYPKLSHIQFEYSWNGVLGMSLDFSASVGVTGGLNNIFYGLSYNAHGVNLAFFFGKVIADLYANDSDRWKELPLLNASLPFVPPEPLKWVGIRGAFAYYRMLDELSV